MKCIYMSLIAFALGAFCAFPSEGGDWFSCPAEITLQIVDENGQPIEGVDVEGYFWSPYTHDAVGDPFVVRTDKDGKCLLVGTGYRSLAGVARAVGYYPTEFDISLGDKNLAHEQGRWSLQSSTVILKGMRNPIPMYANRVVAYIPEQNKPIGFDMEKGDWIIPYGKGRVSDFVVNYTTRQEAVHQYMKQMHFSVPTTRGGFFVKKLDLFSAFVSDYSAPADEYIPSYLFEQKRTPERIETSKDLQDDEYFIIRSRVVTNDAGEVVSANYSKIYGPIRYALWRNQKRIEFVYYFNPTPNDRNLEFDMSRNLLPGGQVNKP